MEAGMKVEHVPLVALRHYDDNPRRIKPERLKSLMRALEAEGEMLEVRPLIVLRDVDYAEDGTVIAGNMRLAAARELGWPALPVVYVTLDEERARRWTVIDNNNWGDWDDDLLSEFVQNMGDHELDLVGFTAPDVSRLRRMAMATADVPVPEPPAEPESIAGEVYELGPHRLLCGDATDPHALTVLMDGRLADCLITDPPYNVDYGGKTGREIANDAMPEDRFVEFLTDALANASRHAAEGAPAYVWYADGHGRSFLEAFERGGWSLRQVLVWVKTHHVLGRQDYQWKHEPCLYGWKPGAAHKWYGGFKETTVIDDEKPVESMSRDELAALVSSYREMQSSVLRGDRPAVSALHPTMKPLEHLERFLINSTREGDVVLDPFGGSGSTLIAADRLGRRCYMAELDPRFCDVIRTRYASGAVVAEVAA
jgi:DNA modification methylase